MKFETFKKNIASEIYTTIISDSEKVGEKALLSARLSMLGMHINSRQLSKDVANMAYDIVMRWDARSWNTLKRFSNRNYNRFKNIELSEDGWVLTK